MGVDLLPLTFPSLSMQSTHSAVPHAPRDLYAGESLATVTVCLASVGLFNPQLCTASGLLARTL